MKRYGRILTSMLGSGQKQGASFTERELIFVGVLNTLTLSFPSRGDERRAAGNGDDKR